MLDIVRSQPFYSRRQGMHKAAMHRDDVKIHNMTYDLATETQRVLTIKMADITSRGFSSNTTSIRQTLHYPDLVLCVSEVYRPRSLFHFTCFVDQQVVEL